MLDLFTMFLIIYGVIGLFFALYALYDFKDYWNYPDKKICSAAGSVMLLAFLFWPLIVSGFLFFKVMRNTLEFDKRE